MYLQGTPLPPSVVCSEPKGAKLSVTDECVREKADREAAMLTQKVA